MSADAWQHCPRCTARGEKRLKELAAKVQGLYGEVSVEKFDTAREHLSRERERFERREERFREDYEFYGAQNGTLEISYKGECQDCHLLLEIDEKREIPGWRD